MKPLRHPLRRCYASWRGPPLEECRSGLLSGGKGLRGRGRLGCCGCLALLGAALLCAASSVSTSGGSTDQLLGAAVGTRGSLGSGGTADPRLKSAAAASAVRNLGGSQMNDSLKSSLLILLGGSQSGRMGGRSEQRIVRGHGETEGSQSML